MSWLEGLCIDKETAEFIFDRLIVEIWMIRAIVAVILFRVAGGPGLIRALQRRNGNASS